jgi:tetratricopeptide (TPR) repeat protein
MTTDASDEAIEFDGAGDLDQALANGRQLLRSDARAAAAQAREILRINPVEGRALRLLGAALRKVGDVEQAEQAELEAIQSSSHHPVLVEAAMAITENRLNAAEHLLRPHLAHTPDDAAALGMLAEIGLRAGAYAAAEELLRKALTLAPSFASARLRLSRVLSLQNRPTEALAELDSLLKSDPVNTVARGTKAAALGRLGDYGAAVAL